uniref:ribonuclease H n=1 Tax=Amazona collaria TaxID=241587 RepID=A0A8B9IUK9_9PSIT
MGVPREGGGHGGEMSQTQHLVQAGTSRDVEARTAGSSQSLGFKVEGKDAATIPQGDRQDFNPLSVEGSSGNDRRGKVWEKLRHHGEDMARWEGRSTRDLAVRLIEVILQTKTEMYPMEMGSKSNGQEQGPGWTRASVGSSAEVRALVGTNEDVSTAQQHPQALAVYHDVPVSVAGTTDGDNQPEPFGDEQVWEDSDDDLLEQAGPPAIPGPSAQIRCFVLVGAKSEEQWREEFPDVWSRYEMDCGRVSREEKVSGGPAPFQKQPPLSAEEEEAVASILQELLSEGLAVEGSSPFNSPLKLTPKNNGKMRLTLNCKAVNKATPRVVAPVAQDTTKLVSTLSPKSRYFSVVDLSNSSYSIPLAEGSRARFAFTFRGQQYLFTRLPQGFHSTPDIVNQRVTQMLSQLGQGDKPWVISYTDDILIAGRSYEETRDRTRAVLELIQKTGFKAKFEKAQLVQPKVVYLGMTIGDKGREIHASKLEDIIKTPCPQDARTLRSLLGQFGFLQDHVPGFWEMASPLHRLTKKQVKWEWGPEQEEVLNRLKCAVLAAPPLRFPDKSQPFLIKLTTGKEAVGATLLQEDECGQLIPVGHSSRILKDHEVSCLQQEKGCLAAVWAVQAFESLTGPGPILIQMPHSLWKYLLRGEVFRSCGTNPHPAQWTLLLVSNGAMAKDHPTNVLVPIAPSLRELSTHIPKANVWFTASKRNCSICFAAVNLEERWLLGCKGGSVAGAELVALKQLLQHHQHSSPLYVYMSCWSLVEKLGNQRGEQQWGCSGKGLWASILRWVHSNPGMLHISCVGDAWSEEQEEREEKEWNLKAARRASAMSGRAGGNWQVWEPSKHEKQEIIAQCHSCLHDGVEGTLARVRQVASWEGDHKQVSHWVRNCLQCADGAGRVLAQRTEGPWSQLLPEFLWDALEQVTALEVP